MNTRGRSKVRQFFDHLEGGIDERFDKMLRPEHRSARTEIDALKLNQARRFSRWDALRWIFLSPVKLPLRAVGGVFSKKGLLAVGALGAIVAGKDIVAPPSFESESGISSAPATSFEAVGDKMTEFVRIRKELDIFFSEGMFNKTPYSKRSALQRFLSELERLGDLPESKNLFALLKSLKDNGLSWMDDDLRSGLSGDFTDLYSNLEDNPEILADLLKYLDERVDLKLDQIEASTESHLPFGDARFMLMMVELYSRLAEEFGQKSVDLQRIARMRKVVRGILENSASNKMAKLDALEEAEGGGLDSNYVEGLASRLTYLPGEVDWIAGQLEAGFEIRNEDGSTRRMDYLRALDELRLDFPSYERLIAQQLSAFEGLGLSVGPAAVVYDETSPSEPMAVDIPLFFEEKPGLQTQVGYASFPIPSEDVRFKLYALSINPKKADFVAEHYEDKKDPTNHTRENDLIAEITGSMMEDILYRYSIGKLDHTERFEDGRIGFLKSPDGLKLFVKGDFLPYHVIGIHSDSSADFDPNIALASVRVELAPLSAYNSNAVQDGHFLTLQQVEWETDKHGVKWRKRDAEGNVLPPTVHGRFSAMEDLLEQARILE